MVDALAVWGVRLEGEDWFDGLMKLNPPRSILKFQLQDEK